MLFSNISIGPNRNKELEKMLLDALDANDKYLIRLVLQIIMVYHGVTKMWYVDSTEVISENMPFDKFEQIVKKVGLKLTRDNRFTNAHYIVSAKKVDLDDKTLFEKATFRKCQIASQPNKYSEKYKINLYVKYGRINTLLFSETCDKTLNLLRDTQLEYKRLKEQVEKSLYDYKVGFPAWVSVEATEIPSELTLIEYVLRDDIDYVIRNRDLYIAQMRKNAGDRGLVKVLEMQDLYEMKKRLYTYWQIYKRIYMAFGAVQLFNDRDENSTRFSVRLGLLESAFFSLLEKDISFL